MDFRSLSWKGWHICLLLVWNSLIVMPVNAIDVVEFDTAEKQSRYKGIISELRCLVCQNQSLADSNADLAKDMRRVVADMIHGDSEDAAILQFMTERYGSFVHYRPSLNSKTVVLWFMPFLLVLVAFRWLPSIIHSHRSVPLSEADRQKIARLLGKQ